MWEIFHQMNMLRAWVFMMHCGVSTARRERESFKYFSACWEDDGANWDHRNLVYVGVIPYCAWEYYGETKIGLYRRVETHLRQVWRRGNSRKLYKKLRQIGAEKVIWMPVKSRVL